MKAKIVIDYDTSREPGKEFAMAAPWGDKILCLGLLEMGKVLLMKTQTPSNIIVPDIMPGGRG